MVKNETLHIRVNGEAKSNAQKTLDVLGLSLSEVVNMLIHQIPLVGGIPFEIKVPLAPESVTFNSKDDLHKKLEEGFAQIREGKVMDADVVMARLREQYGFQS